MSNNNNKGICNRCGSPTVASEAVIRQTGSSLFPVTVTKFICTNTQCQKDSENRQAEILMVKLEREEKSKNNRLKNAKKVEPVVAAK